MTMKSISKLTVFVFFLTCFLSGRMIYADGPAPGLVLYISPTGDDTKTGRSLDQAWATLDHARDEIRKLKQAGSLPPGGVSVQLLGGIYHLDHSFELSEEDSGTAQSPIVYRSYQRQEVRLSGAQTLKLSDFQPIKDQAILDRLTAAAKDHVVCLPIDKLKHIGPYPDIFSDSGGIFELYLDGQRLPLSRWPTTGYTTMNKIVSMGDKDHPSAFTYHDEVDEPARWTKNPNIWVRGQWRVGWEDPALKVASIDPANRQINLAVAPSSGIGNKYSKVVDGQRIGNQKEPWFAMNLLEEINNPGEWALDFEKKQLFLWPPADDPKTEISIAQLDTPMIHLNGTSQVKFIGLTLECSLDDGIVMDKVDSCLVAGCTIKNLSKAGVRIVGSNTGVLSSDIHDVGYGCIYIGGGDKASLTPSKDFAINNHLHHYGVLKHQYSAAVHVGAYSFEGGGTNDCVGVLVAHNLVHHAPRDAFLLKGEDNIFEYNEVYYCAYDTADTGVFYSALDWTIRGIIFRYNYLHDTVGGVNPDDGASGSTAYGNILVGNRIGIWIASGPDHDIHGNIIVKTDPTPVFGLDDRGISRKYATNKSLHDGVAAIHPDQDPWLSRFPMMKDMLDHHPELPWRTRFTGNLIVSPMPEPYKINLGKEFKAEDGTVIPLHDNPDIITIKDNLVVPDASGLFVDDANGNYALKSPDDIARKIPGFEPIPFDKIGLFIDEYRTKLPTEDEAQRGPKYDPYPQDKDKNFGT